MALTKEKNAQIAAMNAKGMCIEAIAKKAGLKKDDVRDSLESRGRSYIEMGLMTSQQREEWIREMQADGKSIPDIMELTGLGKSTIYTYIFYKGKGKTEGEPEEKPDVITPQKKEGKVYAKHTIKEKETVIKLYKAGKMQKEIAAETGLSKSTICTWIKEHKKEHPEEKAVQPTKAGQINEEFDKAVDEMIEESKAEKEEEVEIKQPSAEYLAAVKWAEENGVDTNDKIAFVELMYKEYKDMHRDYIKAKNEKAHANVALGKMQEVVASLTQECKNLEAEKEQFINSPCECDNSRIIKVCETELRNAEKDMLGIYSRMSEAEQRAWDLGEIFGGLMRAKGEYV